MNLTADRDALSRAVSQAQHAAEPKSTIPILGCVLLRAHTTGALDVCATNLNVSTVLSVPCVATDTGASAVSAKLLANVLASLPPGRVQLTTLDNLRLEVRAGRSRFELLALAARDFPRMVEPAAPSACAVDAAILADMIAKTIFSVSSDETRFHLNGCLFECDGSVATMVSTDGHRLSKVERTLAGAPELPPDVIVPQRGLQEVVRLLKGSGSVALSISDGHLHVSTADARVAVKLIEAQFPPYAQVIPTGEPITSVAVSRAELAAAVKRVGLLGSETRGISLTMGGGAAVVLGAEHPEHGDAREEIQGADGIGPAITLGFNPRYVADVLEATGAERVTLGAGEDNLAPVTISPSGDPCYVAVVMPMRL
jgi:DNA polymerase-3 subunit beta